MFKEMGYHFVKTWVSLGFMCSNLSMKFQFTSMSEDSRGGVLLRCSSVRLCLIVLNQGCSGSGQYNLLDRMLRLDANTTLNQSYSLFVTLDNIRYLIGDQYLSSIYFRDSSTWQVLYIPLFSITFFLFSRPLF